MGLSNSKIKSHGCKQQTVRKRKRASALVQSSTRAPRNDAIPNKKKTVKCVEDPRRCELYDIFIEYNMIAADHSKTGFSIELLKEGWSKIRQWVHANKDNDVLLKQAVSHYAHSIISKYTTLLHTILYWTPPLDIIEIFVKYAPLARNRGCHQLERHQEDAPLHTDPSLNVIKAVINAYPETVRVRNKYDGLPLHIACQKASLGVVEALVDAYPEGMLISNDYNLFPLTLAQWNPASLDVIKLLVSIFPENVEFTRLRGDSLYRVLSGSMEVAPIELFKLVVDADPEGVLTFDFGMAVMFNNISLDVLNFLVEFYPEGLDRKDYRGRLPLERMELRSKKIFAEKKDNNDMLPLHHACKMGYSVHLIRALIQAFPEGCLMYDKSGLTPLHYVCRNDNLNKMDTIKIFLKEASECFVVADSNGEDPLQDMKKIASQKDERGMSMLHRLAACTKGNTNEDIFKLVFNANPEAIASPDAFSMLPIHHAVVNEASSLEMLMQLIKLYPESLLVAV